MDIELSEEQQQLQDSARRLLEKACPPAAIFATERDPVGYSRELWSEMAGLGWMGLTFPEQYGGSGMHTGDVVLLTREMGRVQLPSPYIATVLLAGGALASGGSEEQKKNYLRRIAEGKCILGFALQELGGGYDGRSVAATAQASGKGFVLNGEKRFVEYAAAAERMLVVARMAGARAGTLEGLSVFLVDPKAAGVTLSPLQTAARDPQCHVRLKDVSVDATALVGEPGKAWSILDPVIQRAVVAFASAMVGGTEKSMELATDYAKQRVQFGKPIGSFMSIQHYLAQMAIEATAADTLVHYAAWHLDHGMPARAEVARAKLSSANAFQEASAKAAQIYGGMGFVEDVDITLYLRRGKQWQLSMGDSKYWEDSLAAELLD